MVQFELRHLRYFIAVAEELHFGNAARRMNVAQPALSQQVMQLERHVGAELLKRTSRRVEMTPAGSAFLEHARRVLADVERAADSARRAARGELQTLVVGFADSAALSVLPALLRRFEAKYPDVHLELTENSTQAQLTALERSVVDVALVRGPIADDTFDVITLLRERFVVAVPEDHAFAGRRSLKVSALAPCPFVLFSRHLAPAFHDELIAMCRGAGFSPIVRAEAAEYQTILSLVAAGVGVSLVPASVKNLGRTGVTFVSLSDCTGEATVVLAIRKESSGPTLRQFVDVARALPEGRKRR